MFSVSARQGGALEGRQEENWGCGAATGTVEVWGCYWKCGSVVLLLEVCGATELNSVTELCD